MESVKMKLTKIMTMGIVAAVVIAPMPAFAAFCTGDGPNVSYTFSDQGDGRLVIDVEAQALRDKKRLHEIGVIAEDTERWNGCIRAFIKADDGTRHMEF